MFLRFRYLLFLFLFFSNAHTTVAVGTITPGQQRLGDVAGFELQGMEDLTVAEFANMKPREIQQRTGQKMKFKERLALRLVQKKIKRQLRKGERIDEMPAIGDSFNIIGFLLGLFLGLIGMLIAYLLERSGDAPGAFESSIYGALILLGIILLSVIF